jgi:hypothetical protein
MDQVQQEMDEIQDKADRLDSVLDVKSKQFHLVIQSISDLKNGLLEDEDHNQTMNNSGIGTAHADEVDAHNN